VIATIFDTGPIAASLADTDQRHPECAKLLNELPGKRLLPSPVLAEVSWLLQRWPDVEAEFLYGIARGSFELIHLSAADLRRMGDLILEYADLRLGTVDASIVAVAERFGVGRIATLDRRHFTVVRPRLASALTLLP
jgi:predicted nucleic acid-binding protein